MPQSTNTSRPARGQTRRLTITAAKAGIQYFIGQVLCVETATGLGVPAADAAGLVFRGILVEPLIPDTDQGYTRRCHLDNRAGADGVLRGDDQYSERILRSDKGLRYAFPYTGPTPLPEQDAYVVDDESFTADAALVNHDIRVGKFERPGPDGTYFIDFMA